MFTGVSLDQALKYWKNGKEVIVLDRTVKSPSGGYETYSLDELFKNLELLVDVPAVENLEFKQAVADMVQPDQKQEEPSEEKNSTPPPHRAARDWGGSGPKDGERDCDAAGRAGDESSGDCKENRRKIQHCV